MNYLTKVKSIVDYIRVFNSEIVLDPGLSKTQILNAFETIQLTPPSELLELYLWHDGIGSLDCFLNFLTLKRAVGWYNLFLETKVQSSDMKKWQKSWFPILSMNGDVQICLDCENSSLISIDRECGVIKLIATHYDNYLDALVYMFENKAFGYDWASGCIDFHDREWNYCLDLYEIKSPW